MRRVAREELEGTLKELLTVNDQARSTAVHEARKRLKKVRALNRLLRPTTGEAFPKEENAALRKAAQRMSSIRDAHVQVPPVERLTVKSGKRRAPAAFARIRTAMAGVCAKRMSRVKRTIGASRLPSTLNVRLAASTSGP